MGSFRATTTRIIWEEIAMGAKDFATTRGIRSAWIFAQTGTRTPSIRTTPGSRLPPLSRWYARSSRALHTTRASLRRPSRYGALTLGHLGIEHTLAIGAAHEVAGEHDAGSDQADDQARERVDVRRDAELHFRKNHHRQRARARSGDEARDHQVI